ncbi:ArnT family glycosyltransferase [Aquifex sp.]
MFLYALLINLLLATLRVLYILFYPIDLSPEEAQYWDWSRHLDLSYYSKPPMVAYLNFISTHILGNTELGVRINAVILSFLLSVATYLFVKRLFNEKVAFVASTLPNLFVGLSINAVLFTADAPLIFFWGLSLMVLYFAVERNELSLWLLLGLFAGLAFLSKYPAVFLLPLGVLYVFLVKPGLLKDLRIYSSVAVAFIVSLPVLYWNLKHDFISFKHVSALSNKGSSFPNWASLLEFLGGQALLLSVIPFFLLLYAWYDSLKKRDKRLLFLTIFSLPIFLFFALLSLKKRVYANWAGFGYYAGSILIAYYFVRSPKPLQYSTLILGILLTLLLHFTPLFDLLGLRKLLPPKRDPTKFLVGWQSLGGEVSRIYTGKELIFSHAYQISAELAFYVEGNPRTFVFHTGRRTQYYLWRDRLKEYRGRDAIFVGFYPPPKAVLKSFGGYKFLRKFPVYWRGEKVREFYIFKLYKFTGEFYERPAGY